MDFFFLDTPQRAVKCGDGVSTAIQVSDHSFAKMTNYVFSDRNIALPSLGIARGHTEQDPANSVDTPALTTHTDHR